MRQLTDIGRPRDVKFAVDAFELFESFRTEEYTMYRRAFQNSLFPLGVNHG